MKKQINIPLAITVIIIIAGIVGGVILLSSKKQNNDAWGEFSPTYSIPGVNDKFDAIRYSCQGKKIVAEIEEDNSYGGQPQFLWATSIEVMPGNIKLEKIDKSVKFMSYTFSKDCKNIYSIVKYNNEKIEDIFKFNAENGKYTQLTKNLSPEWTTLDEAKPSPIFIYAIDNDKLLVSFLSAFTTGLDAYTNFTIHKIYNLANNIFTKEIAFISDGGIDQSEDIWRLPPTILNFKGNILSNVVGLNWQSDGSNENFKRIDFDLISEKFITTTDLNPNLLKGEDPSSKLFLWCEPNNNEPAEYNKCIKENLANIFPKK